LRDIFPPPFFAGATLDVFSPSAFLRRTDPGDTRAPPFLFFVDFAVTVKSFFRSASMSEAVGGKRTGGFQDIDAAVSLFCGLPPSNIDSLSPFP